MDGRIESLFVYGTLLPGDVRWHHLQPFVTDDGVVDSVAGDLFDTGQRYPAAIFSHDERYSGGTIFGRTFRLRPASIVDALRSLDEVEGVVGGLYHRVNIFTAAGVAAWAYSYGDGLELVSIPDGRWRQRG